MRRTMCAFVGVMAMQAHAEAAPQLKGPAKPPLYWATAVGTEWVYSYKSGIDTSRAKQTIVAAEPRDSGVLVSMDSEYKGKITPGSRILVSADGLLALPRPGKDSTEPLWLLKSPVVGGQTRELPREGWNPPVITLVTCGVESVTVPAGTFEAVRVDCVETRGGVERSRASRWYARDVGLIKSTNYVDSSEVLVSFKPGTGGAAPPGPPAR